MKLEITSYQYDQIQNEMVRLEEQLATIKDTWELIIIRDEWKMLKTISESGTIEI